MKRNPTWDQWATWLGREPKSGTIYKDVVDMRASRRVWEGFRRSSVIANRYAFDAEVITGGQIKQKTNVPAGFALYRRTRGGNESIGDDDSVEPHDGDHFFARPPGVRRAASDNKEEISR